MISADQKNENILSRFDVQHEGSKLRTFRATMNDYSMTVISMDGMTVKECEQMLIQKYGERFVSVVENKTAN